MEASTLQPAASLAQPRIGIGVPLLRLRSDEQLVALFRAGSEDAFRAIHDRYHKRLFAYARQMLPGRQDAEDALQDVFVRAYSGLRASDRDLALRAWLFRVAHNRCIDELRKPLPPAAEVLELVRSTAHDPVAEVDMREALRRLVEDIRRLPDQQRSALLMRELAGMSYAELASSLGISVGAVKSLLVRARLALAQAAEARDTACALIREQLVEAHDRGVRPSANTRKHVRDCTGCKSFRRELRGVSRRLAATVPSLGPVGVLAKLLGFSGGGGAGGGAALLSGSGTAASAGGLAFGVNHVATLIAAAVATTGGAVEIQRTILPTHHHARHLHAVARSHASPPARSSPASISAAADAATAVSDAPPARAPIRLVSRASVIAPAAEAKPGKVKAKRTGAAESTRQAANVITPSAASTTTASQTVSPLTTLTTGCTTDVSGSGQPSSTTSSAVASGTATTPSTTTAPSPSTTSGSCSGTGATSTNSTTIAAASSSSTAGAAGGSTSSASGAGSAGGSGAGGSPSGTAGTAAS